MAGRKVFTSGEILTAADVNSYLMDQSVMVFADSSARSSAIPTPTEGMVTYVEDANRVEVYDGSAFGPIGGILQVVSTTKTDHFSTSSTSFTDITGLSVSITPSSTSSKVLVFFEVATSNTGAQFTNYVNLVRGSTDIAQGVDGSANNATSFFRDSADYAMDTLSMTFLDSPGSTSSLTYKLQIKTAAGAATINRPGNTTATGVVSSITVLEVAV